MFGSLFGSPRKKALKESVEATLPIIRTLEMTGGLPQGFWNDAYVLGFINGCIVLFAKRSAGGNLAGETLGMVIMDAFPLISGADRTVIANRVIELQQIRQADFLRGFENAYKCIMYGFDPNAFQDDPDVIAAKALAAKMPSMGVTDANAQVGGALIQMLFYKDVRQRLGR